MSAAGRTVIVGGGLAGATAAATLREEGYEGGIVLLGEERETPYERPGLSKDYLRGESDAEALRVHPDGFEAEHDIDLRLGVTVSALDLPAACVELADGERIGYDRLLIATGAEPRRLPLDGAELEGVLSLRDIADADALRVRLGEGSALVVIGAGWIGSEVAASARMLGTTVTVVAPEDVPLERVLGPEVGAVYRTLHHEHGVDLRLGRGVAAIEGEGRVSGVRIDDGSVIPCDTVLVGVGVKPRTALAASAGLDTGDGIAVDARLQARVPGVFAAGDVANADHPVFGRPIRVEHWANARKQGAQAARNMLGADEPFDAIPYFFSDQYDSGMEYSGLASDWDRVVFRGDPATREFMAFWLRAGRVLAGLNMNVWDVTEDVQALVRSGAAVDPERLADPETPLGELSPS